MTWRWKGNAFWAVAIWVGTGALAVVAYGCAETGDGDPAAPIGDDDDDDDIIVGDDDDDDDDDDDGGSMRDAGPSVGDDDDDDDDDGIDDPGFDDPFDGAPGIELGAHCDSEAGTFEPLAEGAERPFEPGGQGPVSRHVELGSRAWNFPLEPPPSRPDAPVSEWLTSRNRIVYQLIGDDGQELASLDVSLRFFPEDKTRDLPYRVHYGRLMIDAADFDRATEGPVTIIVERTEGDTVFRDEVDGVMLQMVDSPCTGPLEDAEDDG